MRAANLRSAAAGVLILTGLAGCDNVDWGGADLAVVPPPPRPTVAPTADDGPGAELLPDGAILYYVARTAAGGRMVPVGEVTGDSLTPLRAARDPIQYAERLVAERMRQGEEFALFRNGIRSGTLVIQSAEVPPAAACAPIPFAVGTLELGEGARDATEFLALSKEDAPQVPRRIGDALEPTRTMSFVAPILAERMLRARGATLPGNWQRAMAQVRPFPVAGSPSPGFAATFLVSDTLGPGLDDEGWALLYLAVPSTAQVGWDTVHVQFHDYASGGKASPRVIDILDWDRDEQVELLLQVYGVDDSWFEAIGRSDDGTWRRVFRDRCERAASPAATGEPARIPTPAPNTAATDTTAAPID